MSSYGVTSLFSGCGGLDVGFRDGGFKIRAAYDSDSAAVKCYNSNHSPVAVEIDINQKASEIRRSNVILAGPPCQGFSTASGYKNDDPRKGLLTKTCRIAAEMKPALVVLENVASLSNQKNRSFLEAAITTLSDAGYHVEWDVFSADQFGVAQRRKRLFLVARSDNRPFNLLEMKDKSVFPKKTVRDVLSGLKAGQNCHDPGGKYVSEKCFLIAKNIGPGKKLSNVRGGPNSVHTWEIPEVFGRTNKVERKLLALIQKLRRTERRRSFGDADPVSLCRIDREFGKSSRSFLETLIEKEYLKKIDQYYDLRNTFNGKYRRLAWNDLSPTVDTRFGEIQLFVHPRSHRGMTVREAARIQGFSDDFHFDESPRISYRLIGNAVPPPMAYALAKFVRKLV